MLKTYSSRGGMLASDNFSVDKRVFPFKNETSIDATVERRRFEKIPARSQLLNMTGDANPTTGKGILQFVVDPTTDGTMWNLHDSYVLLTLTIGQSNDNVGISQFASNQIVTDCDIILGSQYVNDKHVNLYPYSAFLKDILMRERPSIPSLPRYFIKGGDFAGSTDYVGGAYNTGMESLTEDVLEEGNYLSHPLFSMATASLGGGALGVNSSVEFMKRYAIAKTIQVKVFLKDSIFMTNKFLPSNNQLRVNLNLNLRNLFVANTTGFIPDVTMNEASFYLNRVFLKQDSIKAFMDTLQTHNLIYTLPYSRVAVYDVPANATSFNVPNVFSDNFRPDLICIYTVLNANTQQLPLTACGVGANISGSEPMKVTGLNITDAYVQMDGEYYPERTVGNTYLGTTQMTAYKEYVANCLVDEEMPYLSFMHFLNHYSVICINTQKNKEKWYNLPPTESNNGGFNLYTTLANGGTAAKLYVVAFNNVHLTIDRAGMVTKHGF